MHAAEEQDSAGTLCPIPSRGQRLSPNSRLLGVSLSLCPRRRGTSQMLNHSPPLNNHILVQSLPYFTKVPWRMRWEDNLPLLRLASSRVTTGSLPLGETRYSFSRTLKRALGTGSSGKELGEALAEQLWRVEACPHQQME